MKEFIMGFFNLDSRFFQTMGNIVIPARLTKKYIAGKRKSYINPARLFLFSLVFFFAVLNYAFKKLDLEMGLNQDLEKYAEEKEQQVIYDSLLLDLKIDSLVADTIRKRLFPDIGEDFQDSIEIGEIGTIIETGGLGGKKFYIGDIASMPEDEFLDHYDIQDYFPRLTTRQVLRVNRNPKAVSNFMIGNMLWAVVLGVLLLAFVMKLLYIRRKHFFVEHLILLMHIHSFLFLLIGVILLGHTLKFIPSDIALSLSMFFSIPFIYASLKLYYKQGFLKTLLKSFLIFISYTLIASVCAVIIVLISMLVF